MKIKNNGFFKVEGDIVSFPLLEGSPKIERISGWKVIFATLFKGGVIAVLEKDSGRKVYVLKANVSTACSLPRHFKLKDLQGFVEQIKERAEEVKREKAKIQEHAPEIEQAKIKNRRAAAAFLQAQNLISEQGPKSEEAIKLLKEAAKDDHIQALFQLGNYYKFKNSEKAFNYFQRAKKLGHQPSLKIVDEWR